MMLFLPDKPKEFFGSIYIPKECQQLPQTGEIIYVGDRVKKYRIGDSALIGQANKLGIKPKDTAYIKIYEDDVLCLINNKEKFPLLARGKYWLIKMDEEEKYFSSDVIIPDEFKHHPSTGIIINIGEELYHNVRRGQKVIYSKKYGLEFEFNKEMYKVIHDDFVYVVIE